LDDITFKLFLGHLLVQEELHVLLLKNSSLKFHGSITTHALYHNTIGLWVERQSR
jgi:hypothetical protein